ncbi:MAG: head maturation protease, ClpP-related [Verrucomicrobiota bacterium]
MNPKTKNSWYRIQAKADAEKPSAEIHIFDEIGFWGISARDFISEIGNLDAEEIALHINSPGGSVFDGVAIQNVLKHHRAHVTTYIDGIAASIASIIALSGDDIKIADNGYVMIHDPSSLAFGTKEDMLKEAEVLDKLAEGLANDYATKMGITPQEARNLMKAETWWLGQEAVDAGFADSVFTGTKAAANFDLNRFSANAPKGAVDRFTNSTPPQSSGQQITKTKASMTPEEIQAMRDENTRLKQESQEQKDQLATAETNQTAAVEAARKETADRITNITALGAKFGFENDAEDFAKEGKSVDAFRAHILNKSSDEWKDSLNIKNPSSEGTDDPVAKLEEQLKNAKTPEQRGKLARELRKARKAS